MEHEKRNQRMGISDHSAVITESEQGIDRRKFLQKIGIAGTAAAAAGLIHAGMSGSAFGAPSVNGQVYGNGPWSNPHTHPAEEIDWSGLGESAESVADAAAYIKFDSVELMKNGGVPSGKRARCARYYTGGDLVAGLEYYSRGQGWTETADGYVNHYDSQGNFLELIAADVNAKQAGAKGDGLSDDTAPIQYLVDRASLVKKAGTRVTLGPGEFNISSTIIFSGRGLAFVGVEDDGRQSGSDLPSTAIVWTGGAAPMFQTSKSYMTFKGFGVRNEGSATDWLDMLLGSQNFIFENLFFIGGSGGGGSHTQFSRSVIHSDGARIGYSSFKRINVKSPAAKFLFLDNGAAAGVTPFRFDDRCMFDTVTGLPVTVVYVKNSSIDSISFGNCTFMQHGDQLTILDTTDTPRSMVLAAFNFTDNEIDSTSASMPSWRWFRFTNCKNIRIEGTQINGGGVAEYLADLVNSSVISCDGCDYKSFTQGLFNPDSTSRIEVGRNHRSNAVNAEFSVATAGIAQVAYSSVISINGNVFSASKHGIHQIDVTNANSYEIRCNIMRPNGILPGQVFTVVVRNVSGGAISTGSFTSNFSTSGPLTAPADGYCRSYTFYWNGSKAVELNRSSNDAAN
ncbi:MAG: Pectate lyase superfamily protein [Paenibacillus sp.]|jgi:hypothetical protein|nr:Pectate lyase superfamily protein [Paenibacillus sp.]